MEKQNKTGPRVSIEEFFAAVDLDLAGLEKVKDAVRNRDFSLARSCFAGYLRKRTLPVWMPGEKKFSEPDKPWFSDKRERVEADPAKNKTADDCLKHIFFISGLEHRFKGRINWAFNPTTARNSKLAHDPEWTWQFNRHHFWREMGRAYRQTGKAQYAKEFTEQVLDWVKKNPVPRNKADQALFSRWRTIECGIRISGNWAAALYYFLPSPDFSNEAIIVMAQSFLEHARYLKDYPTRNNWLAMEMNGLYHAGVIFPEFKEAKEWRAFAAKKMQDELKSQFYPDGAQIELTPGYHNVALLNFAAIFKIARRNGYKLHKGYLSGLERVYAFNMLLMTPDRDLPPFNDSWNVNVPNILREGYTYFKKRKDFLWAASEGRKGTMPGVSSLALPYAGYILQRSGWGRRAGYLAFDAGPLGYHHHEDKLNFMLMAYGKRLIIDAGSYAYDASKWRKYVLSSYGHNVVIVDGLEQNRWAKKEINCVTKRPYPFVFEAAKKYDYAEGTYGNKFEGYGPDAVYKITQRRRVLFVKAGEGKNFWIIFDELRPKDKKIHRYEALFHLGALNAEIDRKTDSVVTKDKNGPNLGIFPLKADGLRVKIIKGREKPVVQGWIPFGHGIRGVNPRPVASFELEKPGTQYMLYVLYPYPGEKAPGVEVKRWELPGISAKDGLAVEVNTGKDRQYKIFFPANDKKEFQISGKKFKGKVFLKNEGN